MRLILAGLILLLSSAAFGQMSGEVESVGFNGAYRPDCFTPMVVRINPQAGLSGIYLLEVKQKDLDGHEVSFTRSVSITGAEGSAPQRFETYFLPQPSGLPDANTGGTLRDLQKELKVFLYNTNGKQIASLPITQSLVSVDPPGDPFGNHRGTRLVLTVRGGDSRPAAYPVPNDLFGVIEDTIFVEMSADHLPENPVAYDGVDAILWVNSDPAELKRGGDEKFRALESYIQQGGHLVICQSPQWQQYLEFGDLLPVNLQGVQDKPDCQPLPTLAHSNGPQRQFNSKTGNLETIPDPWEKLVGPFTFARAQAKPNTVTDEWIDWDAKGTDRSPYIVRQLHGLGAVTWVAQDLGDQAITSRAKIGWEWVWDKVFDWKNSPRVTDKYTTENDIWPWKQASAVDIGPGLRPRILDLSGTVSTLIAVAMAFFIIYWLIAGPGLFAYLASKRRQGLSWFAFAVVALAATGVTVLIVKLIVRGPPELAHSSIIQQAANDATVVRSSFGLYIKRDGDEKLELEETLPGAVSTLTALPMNPHDVKQDDDNATSIEYQVPVRDLATEDPPAIVVPYRSTSKKYEAIWTGKPSGKIDGSAKLLDMPQMIEGTLTNATGRKLEEVYLAFKYIGANSNATDYVLWIRSWDQGVSLDLSRLCYMNDKGDRPLMPNHEKGIRPDNDKYDHLFGLLNRSWQDEIWNYELRHGSSISGDGVIPMDEGFVIMSLFDRLAPIRNGAKDNLDRVEIIRRGARHMDRSSAIAGGGLVVLAKSYGELPVPLTVEGEKITGNGPLWYQYVLPLDREALNTPATQPSASR